MKYFAMENIFFCRSFEKQAFLNFLLAQFVFDVTESGTRRERLKSAPYLRLKKRKSDLFFSQKLSHSAEKCKRGTLRALLTNILFQKASVSEVFC